jgi:enamine deaminase RidA (YjgF/YER057c/UK114 family)
MRLLVIFLIIQHAIITTAQSQSPEEKIAANNIELPTISASLGNYVDVVQVGNLLFLSGKGPRRADGTFIQGKVGSDLTVEQGYQAARIAAINQLAVLKSFVGELRKIKRIVKVNGFVNCNNGFQDQPAVLNGFSDLMVAIFGESGKHTRTAVGTNSLPLNMTVEVELVVELK